MSDHIAPAVMANILQRLSVKDLVRSRRVSKHWLAMLDSPHFISRQLHHSNRKMSGILIQKENSSILYWKEGNSNCNIFVACSPILYRYHPMGIFLLGSCHGLICFSLMYTVTNPNDIILLNPSTGDLHDFPSFKSTEESRKSPWLASYGFGYDELTDDYKVVMMMTVDLDYYSVEIYHVRAKSFTRKHGLQLGHWMSTHDHEQMGVFVGGALHWRIGDMKMPKYYILALDLGSETFRYIPQPDYGEMWCEMMSIGVVDECLCVCVLHKRSGGEIDIWVMDEYGDIDSWCLVVGIEDYVPKSVVSISWNGGQIVLKLDGFVLVWCDQREKNLYQVVRSRLEDGYYRVIYCLESLVKVCPNRSPEVDVHDKQVRRKEEHKAKLVEQDKSSHGNVVVLPMNAY